MDVQRVLRPGEAIRVGPVNSLTQFGPGAGTWYATTSRLITTIGGSLTSHEATDFDRIEFTVVDASHDAGPLTVFLRDGTNFRCGLVGGVTAMGQWLTSLAAAAVVLEAHGEPKPAPKEKRRRWDEPPF